MAKIAKLTAEQERTLVEFRQERWRIGTCCDPADRVEAEAAITAAYAQINRPKPVFFWFPSPMTCELGLICLKTILLQSKAGLGGRLSDGLEDGLSDGLRAGLGAGLRDGLGVGLRDGLGVGLWDGLRAGLSDGLRDGLSDGLSDGLRDGLSDGLRDGLRAGLGDGLRAGLGVGLRAGLRDGLSDGLRDGLSDGLWDGLSDGLWDGLGDGLRAGLRDGLGDGLGDGLRDGLWDGLWDGLRAGLSDGLWDGLSDGLGVGPNLTWWWGQMDSYWLAYFRFGTELGCCPPPKYLNRLNIMERIAASCGWWYPRDGVCLVSDRFSSVSWDDARNRAGLPFRLHNEIGPAISFRDGWALHYWHGVRVPDWVVERPSEITQAKISAEPNAEIKRVMIERYGPARYIADVGGRVIDTCPDDHPILGLRGARLIELRHDGMYEHPLAMVELVNSSPEPDGSFRKYHLSVNGAHYGGRAGREVLAAVASTWRDPDDSSRLIFARPEDYCPDFES